MPPALNSKQQVADQDLPTKAPKKAEKPASGGKGSNTVVIAVVVVLLILGIALGVGLGVGLKKNDSSNPPPVPTSNVVAFSAKFNFNFADWALTNNTAIVKTDLADLYAVNPSSVVITSVDPGSVIVNATVRNVTNANLAAANKNLADATYLASKFAGCGDVVITTSTKPYFASDPLPPFQLDYATPQVVMPINNGLTLDATSDCVKCTFSASPALPAAFTLNTSSGQISVLSSTPVDSAPYVITGTNTEGSVATMIVLAVVDLVPVLSYSSNWVIATVNVVFPRFTPTIVGSSSVMCSIAPALPSGLTMSAACEISGTPTQATADFIRYTVKTSDPKQFSTTSFFLAVNAATGAPSTLSYDPNPMVATVNAAKAAQTPSVTGATRFSVMPTLPTGLAIDAATGVISGTPAAVSVSGNYAIIAYNKFGVSRVVLPLQVKAAAAPATPAYPGVGSGKLTWYVNVPIPTSGTGNGNGVPTSQSSSVTAAAVSWAASCTLPAGVTFSVETGAFSGTPTAVTGTLAVSATITCAVTASNSFGTSAAFSLVIAVEPTNPVQPYASSTIGWTVGTNVTTTAIPLNAMASAYAVDSACQANLTTYGISFDVMTGKFSGAPTKPTSTTPVTATFACTVSVSNSRYFGTTGGTPARTQVLTLSVIDVPPSSLKYDSQLEGTVGFYAVTAGVATVINSPSNSGGLRPTTGGFTVTPALPTGVTLDANTGQISFANNTVKTALTTVSITLTNTGGSSGGSILRIAINANSAPTALSMSPAAFALANRKISSYPLVTGGDGSTFDFSCKNGNGVDFTSNQLSLLNISMSNSTGALSGTPSFAAGDLSTANRRSFTCTATATNSNGMRLFDFTFTVAPVAPAAPVFPICTVVAGVVSSCLLPLPDTTPPLSSRTYGSYGNALDCTLPTGTNFSAFSSTGVVSVTTAVPILATNVTYVCSVKAINQDNIESPKASFTLVVVPSVPLRPLYDVPQNPTDIDCFQGELCRTSIATLENRGVLSYAITNPDVCNLTKTGLEFSTTTGRFTGTLNYTFAAATFTASLSCLVKSTNAGGLSPASTVVFTFRVARPKFAYSSKTPGTVGFYVHVVNTSQTIAAPESLGGAILSLTGFSIAPLPLVSGGVLAGTEGALRNVITVGSGTVTLNEATGAITITDTITMQTELLTFTVRAVSAGSPTVFASQALRIAFNKADAPSTLSYSAQTFSVTANSAVSFPVRAGASATATVHYTISNCFLTATNGFTFDETSGAFAGKYCPGEVISAAKTVVGKTYEVYTVGNTTFALCSTLTSTPVVGSSFVASSICSGTGTVRALSVLDNNNNMCTVVAKNPNGQVVFDLAVSLVAEAPSAVTWCSDFEKTNMCRFPSSTPFAIPSSYTSIIPTAYVGLLPTWVVLNPRTGALSGISPDTAVTYKPYRITVSNIRGTATYVVFIGVQRTESTTAFPAGILQASKDDVLSVNKSVSTPVVWDNAFPWPPLPAGLTVSSAGVISGTPVKAQNAVSEHTVLLTSTTTKVQAETSVRIQVTGPVPTTLSYGLAYGLDPVELGRGRVMDPLVPVVGGFDFYTVSPSLPSGLAINPYTGVISGTPTAPVAFTAGYTVTGYAIGAHACAWIPLQVNDIPTIAYGTLSSLQSCPTSSIAANWPFYAFPAGTVNYIGRPVVTPTGQRGTFAVTAGTLPTGVTLNSADGSFAVAGTAVKSALALITVTFTTPTGNTASARLRMVINTNTAGVPPAISYNTTSVVATKGALITPVVITPILATALVVGNVYKIVALGTTNFSLVGGTQVNGSTFTATAVGTGNGTVQPGGLTFAAQVITSDVSVSIALNTIGLAFDTATGTISGNYSGTTFDNTSIILVTASNANGMTLTTLPFTRKAETPGPPVFPNSTITTSPGTAGTSVVTPVTGFVVSATYTSTCTPALPNNITFSSAGTFTWGTNVANPSVDTVYTCFVTAANSGGTSAAATVSLTVVAQTPGTPAYPSSNTAPFNSNTASFIAGVGGTFAPIPSDPANAGAVSWSIDNCGLPGTITFATTTGTFTANSSLAVDNNITCAVRAVNNKTIGVIAMSDGSVYKVITMGNTTSANFSAAGVNGSVVVGSVFTYSAGAGAAAVAGTTGTVSIVSEARSVTIQRSAAPVAAPTMVYSAPAPRVGFYALTAGSASTIFAPNVTNAPVTGGYSWALDGTPSGVDAISTPINVITITAGGNLTLDENTGAIAVSASVGKTDLFSVIVTLTNSAGSASRTLRIAINAANGAPAEINYGSNALSMNQTNTVFPSLSGGGASPSFINSCSITNLLFNVTTGAFSKNATGDLAEVFPAQSCTVTLTTSNGTQLIDLSITITKVTPSAPVFTPATQDISPGNSSTGLGYAPTPVTGTNADPATYAQTCTPALPFKADGSTVAVAFNTTTGAFTWSTDVVNVPADKSYVCQVTATNSGGTSPSTSVTLTVKSMVPAQPTYPTLAFVAGTASGIPPTADAAATSYELSGSSCNLPPTVTFSETSGQFSATTSARPFSTTCNVTAKNPAGSSLLPRPVSIRVYSPVPETVVYNATYVFPANTVVGIAPPTLTPALAYGADNTYTFADALAAYPYPTANGVTYTPSSNKQVITVTKNSVPGTISLNPSTGEIIISGSVDLGVNFLRLGVTVTNARAGTVNVTTRFNLFVNAFASLNPTCMTIANSITAKNSSIASPTKTGGLSPDISATAMETNKVYTIVTLGNTNWNAIGVPAATTPAISTTFTYNGTAISGTGSGTGGNVTSAPVQYKVLSCYSTDYATENTTNFPSLISVNAATAVFTGTPLTRQDPIYCVFQAQTPFGLTIANFLFSVTRVAPAAPIYTGLTPAAPTTVVALNLTSVLLGPPQANSAAIVFKAVTTTDSTAACILPACVVFSTTTGVFNATNCPNRATNGVSLFSCRVISTSFDNTDDSFLFYSNASAIVSLTLTNVLPNAPVYPDSSKAFVVGVNGTFPPTPDAAVQSYSTPCTLPTGLSFSNVTGVFSANGTSVPTTSITCVVTAVNSVGNSTTSITIRVVAAPVVPTDPTLVYRTTPGIVNFNAFSASTLLETFPAIANTGGGVFSWSGVTGVTVSGLVITLATGNLTLNNSTGDIVKSADAVQTSLMVVRVTLTRDGAVVPVVTVTVRMVVNAATGLTKIGDSIQYSSPTIACQRGISCTLPSRSGGAEATTFFIGCTLPQGLAFDNSNGVFFGVALALQTAQVCTVTVSNTAGSLLFDLTVSVVEARPADFNYPDVRFVKGQALTFAPSVDASCNGPLAPASYAYDCTNPYTSAGTTLPSGITFSSATGSFSGGPTGNIPLRDGAYVSCTVTAKTADGVQTRQRSVDVYYGEAKPISALNFQYNPMYFDASSTIVNIASYVGVPGCGSNSSNDDTLLTQCIDSTSNTGLTLSVSSFQLTGQSSSATTSDVVEVTAYNSYLGGSAFSPDVKPASALVTYASVNPSCIVVRSMDTFTFNGIIYPKCVGCYLP